MLLRLPRPGLRVRCCGAKFAARLKRLVSIERVSPAPGISGFMLTVGGLKTKEIVCEMLIFEQPRRSDRVCAVIVRVSHRRRTVS